MRPYLAIIGDSFREALVSRVLWILLAIITLFLAALLPLGIIEQEGSYLGQEDILNRDRLIAAVEVGKSANPSPAHRIWQLLDDSTREALTKKSDEPLEMHRKLVALTAALQGQIARRDFYTEDDWADVRLPGAARTLYAKGLAQLSDEQVARFNRLALEAAFPDDIVPAPPKQVQLAYLHWKLGLTLPVDPDQLHPAMNQLIVLALGTVLGAAGVFVAVLVTASMIPQAFEAGSVDLLLSKPISRSWLFLAKFAGGCAFIAINAAYFIGGLWLILGLRFGLWNHRLLLAIPLYLFLFAIYYSVSSLAGLIWRNAIVSVVLAILFWFVCWLLGTATTLVETLALAPRRLNTVVPAGDSLLAVDQGAVYDWNDADQTWQKVFVGRDPPLPFMIPQRMAGPVYDPAAERIFAFRTVPPGFGPFQARSRLLAGQHAAELAARRGRRRA